MIRLLTEVSLDQELEAITTCAEAIDSLPEEARNRVMDYLNSRFPTRIPEPTDRRYGRRTSPHSVKGEILNTLRPRRRNVNELAEALNMKKSTLSFHLSTLKSDKLLNNPTLGVWELSDEGKKLLE